MADMVNNPPHYKDASGVECIEVTRYMQFCGGNCFKYLYRAGQKGDVIEDLEKARWYAERAQEMDEYYSDPDWAYLVREVARYRDYGICTAMITLRWSRWAQVVKHINAEINRLKAEADR